MIPSLLWWLWSFVWAGLDAYAVTFFLGICVLCIIYWIKQRHYQHSLFARFGIPYVKPHLLYGSYDTLRAEGRLSTDVIGDWIKMYGPVFGYFIGQTPYMVVRDLDMIRQVLVKDFHNFSNRPKLVIEAQPVIHTVVGLRDQKWKDVRSVLAPTFSMVKMKKMTGIMNTRVTEFLNIVSKASAKDEPLEFYSIFQGLTLDVISECALAMKTNCQRDQNQDELFSAVRSFLRHAVNPAILIAIYFSLFGKLMGFISNHLALSGRMTNMIVSHLKTVLNIRRKDLSTKYIDVLQLMIEAAETNPQQENTSNGANDFKENSNDNKNSKSSHSYHSNKENAKKRYLSDEEIIANAWVFLLAGFETTANSLTSTAYLLALNPLVQEKLFQELREDIEDETEELTYDTVHNLPYLDQVFSEALRIFPPVVTFVTRETHKEYQLGKYRIPKETNIMIPIWQIHHDPELWPDPKFDPDRFSSDVKATESRHPMSYIPFGAGPRACVGIRFAQLEAKLTLARLLRNFRLETCSETPIPMEFEIPTVTLIPAKGVMLRAVPRE
ncbi:hypothetical protein SK128_013372 [Halocaridina rubra]|uniref:Cytochrome P450 n=1 Tax=Halocaridina rubra TaxID=373956 RepID=A0AAN9A2X3_HALRR